MCITSFISELRIAIRNLRHSTYEIIIGDINIDIANDTLNAVQSEYYNVLIASGYYPCIKQPTRVVAHSQTCLDHIFIKSTKYMSLSPGIYTTSMTDHYGIILGMVKEVVRKDCLGTNTINDTEKSKIKFNLEKFLSQISLESWSNILEMTEVDPAISEFTKTIQNYVVNNSDLITYRDNSKFKKLKPWISKGLIVSIRKRDAMHMKIKRLENLSGTNINNKELKELKNKYKLYRNYLNKLIHKTKNMYYANKINNDIGNPKKVWTTINEITNRKSKNHSKINRIICNNNITYSSSTDSKKMANFFNDYFANVGSKMASEITNSNGNPIIKDYEEIDEPNASNMFLHPISIEEITGHISNLNNDSACGTDGLSAAMLKAAKHHIALPLRHIFNLCIDLGTFPADFKTAIIIPIYKGKDKTLVENYRPISLLTHLSKVLEKCIKTRLLNFVEKYNILSPNQFGFRPKLSTSDAIYELTSKLYKSLDDNKKSMAVFIDLAKAFDTVDHALLVRKLYQIGVRGLPLKLIKSYLFERQQFVQIENSKSDFQLITYGVPQGTVLGPILFIIYINNLCNLNIKGNIITYADDTVVLFEDKSWEQVFKKANETMKLVYSWLNTNRLTINKTKTMYVSFSINNKTQPSPNHKLQLHEFMCQTETRECNCYEIKSTRTITYLGITIDNNLKWQDHISVTVSKLRNVLYIYYRLRNILENKILMIVYSAIVQSIIQYGIIGWGGASKINIEPILKMQRTILKIILNKSRYHSTALTFKNTQVMDARQLYLKTILIFLHTHSTKLNTALTPNRQYTRSSRYIIYNLPTIRRNKQRGQQHIDFIGPRVYNKLPVKYKEIPSSNINSFKYNIRHWILEQGRDYCIKQIYF